MLKGTEKQIKWAEDIIREARETIKNNIENIKALQQEYSEKFDEEMKAFRQDEVEAYELCGKQMEAMLENIDSAAKIIDMREKLSSRNINKMVNDYCYVQKGRR